MPQAFMKELNNTFNSGKTKPLAWRRQQLQAMQALLVENEQDIYDAVSKDVGKCKFEAYMGEYSFVLHDIKLYLKNLKKWSKARKVKTPILAKPGKCKIQPEPLGTILIMGAWNFPFQLIFSPLTAVIAAGNCAVLKPSELAPESSKLIAKLVPQYMDTSAFKVVEGGIEETTEILKQRFDHIMYTGSEVVGKIVMRAASQFLTPVTLELGGKSPCIIDKGTNLKVTADRIIWGRFTNTGQVCVAPDYLLVTPSVRPALVEALKKSIVEQYGSDATQSKDYGKIINQRHHNRITGYLKGNEDNIVYGGSHNIDQLYIEPTLILNPALDSDLMQQEIFGPLLPIVEIESIDKAIDFINSREKPLALYAFSNDKTVVEKVTNQTSAGSQCINDVVMFMMNDEFPFGGIGNSGIGSYHGKWGFDNFSHLKPVMHRPFYADAPLRYAPFTDKKQKLFKLLEKLQ